MRDWFLHCRLWTIPIFTWCSWLELDWPTCGTVSRSGRESNVSVEVSVGYATLVLGQQVTIITSRVSHKQKAELRNKQFCIGRINQLHPFYVHHALQSLVFSAHIIVYVPARSMLEWTGALPYAISVKCGKLSHRIIPLSRERERPWPWDMPANVCRRPDVEKRESLLSLVVVFVGYLQAGLKTSEHDRKIIHPSHTSSSCAMSRSKRCRWKETK